MSVLDASKLRISIEVLNQNSQLNKTANKLYLSLTENEVWEIRLRNWCVTVVVVVVTVVVVTVVVLVYY